MVARLIGGAVGSATSGEAIVVLVRMSSAGQAVFSISRPGKLAGVADAALMDPGFDPGTPYPESDLLGLGFTLRLVQNFAREVGGSFAIRPEQFILTVPAVEVQADLPVGMP